MKPKFAAPPLTLYLMSCHQDIKCIKRDRDKAASVEKSKAPLP